MFRFLMILLITCGVCYGDDASKILEWKGKTKLGGGNFGRVFECSGEISLGGKWKNYKPEILIKTLDKDGYIIQLSESKPIANDGGKFELMIPKVENFSSFRIMLRHKKMVEIFEQTYKERDKSPELLDINLMFEKANVVFKKKANVVFGKSGLTGTIEGVLLNSGSHQCTNVKVKGVLIDRLGKEVKKVEFIINDSGGNPVVFDGYDLVKFDYKVDGVGGVGGGKFSLEWEGENNEVLVDNGLVGLAAEEFTFDKVAGQAQITKIKTKFEGKDLHLKVTILNGLGHSILNPVIELKLTNSSGEVIQPLKLEFEGELGTGQSFEFPYVHKNSPQFSGIEQSLRYSNKK